MIQVGDRVKERLESISATLTGIVVYVHPAYRYYTVEFKGAMWKFRESFPVVKCEWDRIRRQK